MGSTADIEIALSDEGKRLLIEPPSYKREGSSSISQSQKVSYPLYLDGETVCGKVNNCL